MTTTKPIEYLYVGTQFLLFLAYLPNIQLIDFEITNWISHSGLALAFSGTLLAFLAIYQIRKSVSAFPGPLPETQLVTTGVFKFIRHPIYSGILLAALGYGLYSKSLYRILITAVLYILFYFKSRYEEKLLRQKFPEYLKYQQNTGRFWPSVN